MTNKAVIAAIRKNHLKANISNIHITRQFWSKAWLDGGGTIFGSGPYVHLPVIWCGDRVTIRVYPPARLQRSLAKRWSGTSTR